MEHRYSPRIPTAYRVAICQSDQPAVVSETGNVSKHGMFIKTEDLLCKVGNYFRVELTSKLNWRQEVSINALVVHRNDQGVGVVLERALDIWPEIYEPYQEAKDAGFKNELY